MINDDEYGAEAQKDKAYKAMAYRYWVVFSAGMGKGVLDDLKDRYLNQNPYKQGDKYHTAFQCGQMDTVMDIENYIEYYKTHSKLEEKE